VGNKTSNNKLLIILASVFIVGIIVLVVVILNLNKDESDGNRITSEGTTEMNSTGIPTGMSSSGETESVKDELPADTEGTTPVVDEKSGEETESGTEKDANDSEREIRIGEYKGLKVEYSPFVVTDEMIDDKLKELQNENTTVDDMPDRPFEKGDMVIVTYEGRVDGIRIEDLSVYYLQADLGSGMLPKEMEEKIIGSRKGDYVKVSIEYPDDYKGLKEIAGKTVDYTAELVTGFVYVVPELNDTFIKETTEYSSLEEYRSREKEKLQDKEDKKAQDAVKTNLRKQVVDNSSFPESLDKEIKISFVKQFDEANNYMQETYYTDVDSYYQMVFGYEPGQYSKELMESIEYDTKYKCALDEIVKKENIQVSDTEIDEYFEKTYKEENGFATKEEAYSSKGEQKVREEIIEAISRDKADKLIYDSADIKGLDR